MLSHASYAGESVNSSCSACLYRGGRRPVERVFSLVKAYFGGNRNRLMSDYTIEASLQTILNDPNKI